MNKTLLASMLAALFLGACSGSDNQDQSAAVASESAQNNNAATSQLNLYIWSDYTDPDTIAQFEKNNSVEVTQAFYDSNEALEAKVLTGKSGFDLVVPSIANVGRQIKAGAYQEIDKSQIPNYNNIDPELLKLMAQVDAGQNAFRDTGRQP